MERLWAPWRMQYVGREQRPGCLFCRVIEQPDDDDARLVVWRPKGAIVLLNKFPYNPGHAMVAPIAHKASLEDLDDAESADLMSAVRRTFTVLRTVMKPDGL
ncbi:MAG: HIT domain-containing protein, partial [Chloroflexi bacterium]